MGQEREGGRRGVAALPCVYSSCTASSRTTVYPPGTYLRRPVHVYLLHGCSSQFALRPLDFRRGAFDARNNFFFSLLLFPTPTILSLWPRPVRRTKRGRWRDRARWLKGGRGEPPLLVDVHFSGTYRFFGGERNGTLFAVEFSSRR